jgi:transposase
MKFSQLIRSAEVERMMKLQDVLLKAMAKRISWLSAAEIIGVTPRTMRRWRERLEEQGYDGLRDRRKGKTSQRRVALEILRSGFAVVPGEVLRLERSALRLCGARRDRRRKVTWPPTFY